MRNLFIPLLGAAFGFLLTYAFGKSLHMHFGSFQPDTGLVMGLFGVLAGYSLATLSISKSSLKTQPAQKK